MRKDRPHLDANNHQTAQQSEPDFVRLYTDGACSGNPGPGGWSFILEHPATGKKRSHAGAEHLPIDLMGEILFRRRRKNPVLVAWQSSRISGLS